MQSERQALSEDNAPDQAAVVIVIAVNVAINVEYRRVCCTRTDRQTHFAFSTKAEKKTHYRHFRRRQRRRRR